MMYFKSLFYKLNRELNHVWDFLAKACSTLYPKEVKEEIKMAIEEDYFSYDFLEDHNFLAPLNEEKKFYLYNNPELSFIEDIDDELSDWCCFSSMAYSKEKDTSEKAAEEIVFSSEFKKVK